MLTVIITVVMFLVLISVHEFGHFIMAKLTGIKVLEFSVGMGPSIFKIQGQKTLYSIRVIPIGGYCRFVDDVNDDDALNNQKKYKRFLVLVSGAFLNIVLGYFLFVIMTGLMPHPDGEPNQISVPVVENVVENSYIAESGLMVGDEIIEINGKKVGFYQDIALYSADFKEDTLAEIKVKRGEDEISLSFKPTLSQTTYNYKEDYVEVVTSINGHTSSQKYDYAVVADETEIAEMVGKSETQERLIIGFTPKSEVVGINNIFQYSYHYTVYVVKLVYKSVWDLVRGRAGLENISGPVGIVGVVNDAVETGSYGFVNVLFLAAVITINLGIFNLLPLPALDGGRLVFLLIEAIIGKKISAQSEEVIHTIGLVLLMLLGIVVAFSDVFKLIR